MALAQGALTFGSLLAWRIQSPLDQSGRGGSPAAAGTATLLISVRKSSTDVAANWHATAINRHGAAYPMDFIDSVGPAGPIDFIDSVGPAGPTDSVDAVGPAGPAGPLASADASFIGTGRHIKAAWTAVMPSAPIGDGTKPDAASSERRPCAAHRTSSVGTSIARTSTGSDPINARGIAAAVAYNNNAGALDNLEKLVIQILAAIPSGYIVGDVSRPSIVALGSSNLLISDIDVSTYYKQEN